MSSLYAGWRNFRHAAEWMAERSIHYFIWLAAAVILVGGTYIAPQSIITPTLFGIVAFIAVIPPVFRHPKNNYG